MEITVQLDYWEHGVVPYRCRNPRSVRYVASVAVEVAEVSTHEAPVAFRHTQFDRTEEWRWFDRRLFTRYLPWSGQSEPSLPGTPHFPSFQRVMASYAPGGLDAGLDSVAAEMEQYLIVDGVVWRQSGEPRYEIFTLGLGHNHSGSGFGIRTHFNGNVHRDRYFRADQYEEAKAAAIDIATRRGDTNSIPMIEREPRIEVLIPEAVQVQPATHGEGDPFLTQMYALSEASSSVAESMVLNVATALSLM